MTAAARTGGQTLTVKESASSGLQRRYIITDANKRPAVSYGTVTDSGSGWQAFPGNGQVSGKAGQVATVVDCTASGAYAHAKGEATLPAPTPAPQG